MWVLLSIRLTEQCIYGDCGSHQEPVQFLPEWQYVQRVVVDTAPFFSPLEEVIRTHFLPASLVSPWLRSMRSTPNSSHTVSLGGLAIRNPVDTAPSVHKVSLVATRHLAVFLVDPATRFDLGAHCICATKAGLAARRDRLQMSTSFSTNLTWQDGISKTVPLAGRCASPSFAGGGGGEGLPGAPGHGTSPSFTEGDG